MVFVRLGRFLLIIEFLNVFCVQRTLGRKAIVIAVSGCRYDYVRHPSLRGIQAMMSEGASSVNVYPVFPASTYPNLYTLATGLYPENHGFVNDIMYEESIDEFFVPNSPNSKKFLWWKKATPIWSLAESNGLKTALYWWPGCEITNYHPSICESYRPGHLEEHLKQDMLLRVDDILEMFKTNELDLAMIYFGLVAERAYQFGSDSAKRMHALQTFDDILVELKYRIKEHRLRNEVNLIVVSDHGVTNINTTVDIERFSDLIEYQVSYGALSMILPKPGHLGQLLSQFKLARIKGIQVMEKKDIPIEYHIKESSRTLPIFLQADPGYYIKPLKDLKKVIGENQPFKAIHGYDPVIDEGMRTVFFAVGPNFTPNITVPFLSNVDLFNVMCYVIGLTPPANNGSWHRIKPMLEGSHNTSTSSGRVPSINNVLINMPTSIMCLVTLYYCLRI